jgi:hypothetical protein
MSFLLGDVYIVRMEGSNYEVWWIDPKGVEGVK